jgi:2,5-diketo-D-gluconate reductase A
MDIPTISLNTKANVPVVGLGTWQLKSDLNTVLSNAYAIGYRHIDTAKYYGNEEEIGHAIKKNAIPRDELFIATKLWGTDHGRAKAAIDESLERLGMDYVDLYLIHWPSHDSAMRQKTWKDMEAIYKSGKAKAIGVSNYDIEILREMDGYAEIRPAMNQVEVNPFSYPKELIEYCHEHKIVVTNYSPLVRGRRGTDDVLEKIAEAYGKTASQVMLRWGVQLGNIVIPKASQVKHLEENIDIFDFELTKDEMREIGGLGETY